MQLYMQSIIIRDELYGDLSLEMDVSEFPRLQVMSEAFYPKHLLTTTNINKMYRSVFLILFLF